MGCLLGIFGGIGNGLRWCFTNSWKGLVVLAVVIVVLIVGFNVVKGKLSNISNPLSPTTATTTAPSQQIGVPSIKDAPFIVQTTSRYYFATRAVKDKKTNITTMTGYWSLSGNKWIKGESLVMGKEFGDVKIVRRK